MSRMVKNELDRTIEAIAEARGFVLVRKGVAMDYRAQLIDLAEAVIAESNHLPHVLGELRLKAEAALSRLRHYHVNRGDGTDTCKSCGKDLRNSIHLRLGEVAHG